MIINCNVCGKPFERPVQRGRPAVRCPDCREKGLQSSGSSSSNTIPSEAPKAPFNLYPLKEENAPPSEKKVEIPFRATTYQVLVGGGLGTVYAGESLKDAEKVFGEYEKKSKDGFGQVGFESVQMWKLNPEQKRYESIRLYVSDHVPVM